MDKKEAIDLLKREDLISRLLLEKESFESREFQLWINKIENIIRSGLEHEDINTFYSTNLLTPVIGFMTPPEVKRNYYNKRLDEYFVNIEKIIQKYELLGIETKQSIEVLPEEIFHEVPPKAFISHGKESAALRKLKEFLDTLGVEPVIVKIQASLDKTVGDKVEYYLSKADFVIVLATADDEIDGKMQPRQNIIHEIGLAQKTHPGKIIYLLEEGAEFPSNIRPKVWESFKQRNMLNAFLGIVRELRAYGILQVTKYPIKEKT